MLSEIISSINEKKLNVNDIKLFEKLKECFPHYVEGISFMWYGSSLEELHVTINDLHIVKCSIKDYILYAQCC